MILVDANSSNTTRSGQKSGEVIKPKDYPYVVSIQISGIHWCFGSLVSKKFVLTLTSCIRNHEELHKLEIRVGNLTEKLHSVDAIHHHPKFSVNANDDNYVNDIALIELTDKISVEPVGLYKAGEDEKPGAVASVIGLGDATEEKTELRMYNVTVVARTDCEKKHEGLTLSWDQICAGENNTFDEFCLLDRGAPLVVGGRLIGIYDVKNECDKSPGKPMVYTWVGAHRDWINAIVPELKIDKDGKKKGGSASWIWIVLIIFVNIAIIVGLIFGFKYLYKVRRANS